jgi:hypothetical protein
MNTPRRFDYNGNCIYSEELKIDGAWKYTGRRVIVRPVEQDEDGCGEASWIVRGASDKESALEVWEHAVLEDRRSSSSGPGGYFEDRASIVEIDGDFEILRRFGRDV